jgi:hypothetical protein
MDPEIPLSQTEQVNSASGVPKTLGAGFDPYNKLVRSGTLLQNIFSGRFFTQAGLKNSAENMFLAYRSEKLLGPPIFSGKLQTSPIPLLQHPPRSAIGWQGAVHTRQERATKLQSIPNTSSSSFVI